MQPVAAVRLSVRLDQLGRLELVRFDYRPIAGPAGKPPLSKRAGAVPTFDAATYEAARELGWDAFWASRPAGAARWTRLDAAGYEDAVRAAHRIALTSRPGMPDGDKQAQAVIRLDDGSWYCSGLGGIDEARQSAWLLRTGSYVGYWRPTATSFVSELVAVVGGVGSIDLRGAVGKPVPT